MQKIINSLMILAMICTTYPVNAFQKNNLNFSPYIGLDAQWRHMDFKKGLGQNLVKHDYPQGNAYAGVKVNEYLGLEVGYESTTSKTRTKNLLGSDDWFGRTADTQFPDDNNAFHTTTKIRGSHMNIAGFLPISDRLQLIASVGIARLKVKINNTQFIIANIPLARPDVIEFRKTQWIPKATIGLQYMINNQFGIRATGGWENTARFKNITPTSTNLPPDLLPQRLVAKLKNSINLGFGLFYNFN